MNAQLVVRKLLHEFNPELNKFGEGSENLDPSPPKSVADQDDNKLESFFRYKKL